MVSDVTVGILANSSLPLTVLRFCDQVNVSLRLINFLQVSEDAFIQLVENFGGTLKKIYAKGCFNNGDRALEAIADNALGIEVLNISQWHKVTDAGLQHISRCYALKV
jgi:hypothetical protein